MSRQSGRSRQSSAERRKAAVRVTEEPRQFRPFACRSRGFTGDKARPIIRQIQALTNPDALSEETATANGEPGAPEDLETGRRPLERVAESQPKRPAYHPSAGFPPIAPCPPLRLIWFSPSGDKYFDKTEIRAILPL